MSVPVWAAADAARGPRPNVFLVTIDTLRADHVGCYGYSGVKTPAMDGLARDGIRFANAFTPVPVTNSSHASILTGLYPSSHGVTDFGVALAASHLTWASFLQKQGYQTAAFIGAVVLDAKSLAPGFDQGFDYYDNFPPHAGKGHWDVEERRGMTVVQHAEKWLDHPRSQQSLTQSPAGPFFLWVHLYDPHDPYEPPVPYSETYRGHLYDGEIAYADHALGDFLAYLRRRGWYDNSLIVLVGDHGEGLGDHKEQTHGIFLYDSTLHVPLLIKLPRQRQAGKVVSGQVRTIDILPTVLGLLGISSPGKMDGASLQPLLQGAVPDSRPLFGETEYPLHFGWAPLRCVRAQGGKFIQAPRPEYYDLAADPHELRNLYSAAPAGEKTLQALLTQHQAGQHGGKLSAANAQLPDPKDKIEEENLLHDALLESDRGHAGQARLLLKKVLEKDSGSALALAQLGQLELQAGDYRQAAAYLGKARQWRPGDSTSAFYQGQALFALGDFAAAAEALETTLRLLPEQMPARLLLARTYLKLDKPSAAEDQLQAALLVDPQNPEAQLELGRVLLAEKKFADAAGQLKTLAQQHPTAEAYQLLSQAYAAQGKKQLAAGAARRAAALKKTGARTSPPSPADGRH
ncbi:MAG TPA: sulfatase-like hydrolase/transferase [Terriglobales bacterium]|nr:sulfatase-like hydrolase/transferase [Terriglobales bacterium]